MNSFSIDTQIIEINLEEIEREFDVKVLKFNGFFIWHAIRALLGGLHLWSFDSKGFLEKNGRKTMSIFHSSSSKKFNELYVEDKEFYFLASRKKEVIKSEYDILFIEAYDSLINDKKTKNRIFEPFKNKFKNFSQLSIFPYDNNARKIDFGNDFVMYKKCIDKYLRTNYTENNIAGLRELFNFIKKKGYICPFTYDYVDGWIKSIFIRSDVFLDMFKQFKPRLVFLTSFYSSERMAAVLACKKLGVKTIEIQHGILGPNFYNLPISKVEMELIPDLFWLWGDDAKLYMERHCNSNLIVGGKLDLFDKLKSKCKSGEPRDILIIEQYTHSHTMDMVRKAVSYAELHNIKILLRLHPRSQHLISNYREAFPDYDNFEVERPTLLPLYQIMNEVKIVIVESSTVAHEAVFFGKSVVVYGNNARKFFSKYIQNGSMIHFNKFDDIFKSIHKLKSNSKNTEAGYFLSSESLMQSAISRIEDLLN
ncbi:hypothetical protein [Aeromonas veronii]|uniref:hypothetical protein n=5 Tax=Aeromonas veronii TaxID=654 RepID=UPI003A4D5510